MVGYFKKDGLIWTKSKNKDKVLKIKYPALTSSDNFITYTVIQNVQVSCQFVQN